MSDLERNEDRWWYDRGYSLGVTETKRDAAVPRLIGAWALFGLALWEPVIAGTFLAMYTLFTASDWHDRRREAEHQRELYDPGRAYEWGGHDE